MAASNSEVVGTPRGNGEATVLSGPSSSTIVPLQERQLTTPTRDQELDKILCDVLGSTFVRDGGLSCAKTHELFLGRPGDLKRLGGALSHSLDKMGGATVLSGIDVMGIELASHVAPVFDELQQSFGKRPVLRLPFGVAGGKPQFPTTAVHLFKGASVILVLPVITPSDWDLIAASIQLIESMKNNASVVGVGAVILYGEPPINQIRLRDLPRASLLEVRGI